MKKGNCNNTEQDGRFFGRIGQLRSMDRVLDYVQGTLVYIDQFGFCAGLIMGSSLLISLASQAAHSGAEKGVI
jgi:hypothetical protein